MQHLPDIPLYLSYKSAAILPQGQRDAPFSLAVATQIYKKAVFKYIKLFLDD